MNSAFLRNPTILRRSPASQARMTSYCIIACFSLSALSACTEIIQNFEDTCVPDTLKCVEGDVYKCKEDGSAFLVAKECAPDGPCGGEPPDCAISITPANTCQTDSDCESQLGTVGECYRATCEEGTCKVRNRDGEACDDGSECTLSDTCAEGICLGTLIDCNDDNICTLDECQPETGCVNSNLDGNICDDQNPCTVDDTCGGGECQGTPKICNDGNPCTDDLCDASTGNCASIAISSPCDDGDACTNSDLCQAGICIGTPAFACETDEDCGTCDSNDPCKGQPRCGENGFCILDPTTAFQCPQTGLGTCDINQCITVNNEPTCQIIGLEDGTMCSDGSECTVGDVCQGGSCIGTVDSTVPGCGVYKLTWWEFNAGIEQATDNTYILQAAVGSPNIVGSCIDSTYRIQAVGLGVQ